jgi:predicted nucleic acid-binding protein
MIPDTSFLVSAICTADANHPKCYPYWLKSQETVTWCVPDLVFFEYQATQSRLARERRMQKAKLHQDAPGPYRELRLHDKNSKRFRLTNTLLWKIYADNLYDLFEELKGADLMMACMAKVQNMPLVTCDSHFDKYSSHLSVVNLVQSPIKNHRT